MRLSEAEVRLKEEQAARAARDAKMAEEAQAAADEAEEAERRFKAAIRIQAAWKGFKVSLWCSGCQRHLIWFCQQGRAVICLVFGGEFALVEKLPVGVLDVFPFTGLLSEKPTDGTQTGQ